MGEVGDAESNEGERRRWNDERWTSAWPKREALTSAVTPYLIEAAALQPGERVLDVGCGGGPASIAAARAVGPTGAVVGADLSRPLTRLARERAEAAGATNTTFQVVDVQTGAITGGPFDVALSQFGVMFFDEPETAFVNIRAHLAPAGRIAFACWRSVEENPWFYGPAIADLLPPPPEPLRGKSLPGPFSLADADATEAILARAGFVDIHQTPGRIAVEAPPATVVDDAQLEVMGVPTAALPRARAAVAEHLRPLALANGLARLPLAFTLVAAAAG